MSTRPDIPALHAVRIFAIACVVTLHVAAQAIYLGAPIGSVDWWIAVSFNGASRVCVPILFMVTGALMLGRQDRWWPFMKGRFRRIWPAMGFWSLLYLALVHGYEAAHPSGASSMDADVLRQVTSSGWWGVAAIAVFPMYYHLWFLYALTMVYWFVPLMQRGVARLSTQGLWLVVAVWAAVTGGLTFVDQDWNHLAYRIPSNIFGNAGYLVLGHALMRLKPTPLAVRIAWVLALVTPVFTVVGTYWLSARDGKLNLFLQGSTPNMVLAAAAVLFLFVVYGARWSLNEAQLARLKLFSATSFGVYLLHPFWLYWGSVGVLGFKLHALTWTPLVMIPVLTAAVYALSHAVVKGLMRVPYLRAVVM